MKNLILSDEKKIIDFKKKSNLLEGIILLIICIITFEYDRTLGDTTLLWLFPIMLFIISINKLLILDKYKELDNKFYIPSVILTICLAIIPCYIMITKNIDKNIFLSLLALSIILKNAIEYLMYNRNTIIGLVKNILSLVIALLLVIFNSYIANNLIIYLIILFALIAVLKLVYYFLAKKFGN